MSDNIYTYIETNFNIKVTDYIFKRDYIKEPLQKLNNHGSVFKYEEPNVEDYIYLYITLNLTRDNVCKLLNVSYGYHKDYCKKYNIKKSNKKIHENIVSGTEKKYGVSNYTQTDEWKASIEMNNIQKYGVKWYVQTNEFKDKSKTTKLERYGDENYTNKEKLYETNMRLYGTKFFSQTDEYKNKIIQTNNQKYGVDWYMMTDDFYLKSKLTKLKKYGNENYNNWDKSIKTREIQYGIGNLTNNVKAKETKLERYGVENFCNRNKAYNTCLERYGYITYLKTPQVRIMLEENKKVYLDKARKTCLERYGETSYTKTNEYKEKSHLTKKKNNSYGKSNEEEIIYKKLKETFNNVKRQYKSDLYPYPCDFYIPKLDLYIEYQGYWTHNFEPYTGTDEQIEKVKLWESKNTKQYKRAIDTWTKRDVLKRETAKQNNLNYLEFFNMGEFNKWFDQQEKKGK